MRWGVGCAGLSLLALSCFQPLIGSGTLTCGQGGMCPDDLACGFDNLCYRVLPEEPPPGPRISAFRAQPDAFVIGGLDTGLPEVITVRSTITQEDGLDLEPFTATSAQPWVNIALDATNPAAVVAAITVDTATLTAGVATTTLDVIPVDGQSAPTAISVELTLADWVHVHAGPSANRCPHTDSMGMPVSTCDFVGPTALIDAGLSAVSGQRILVYDDGGSPADYDGNVELQTGVRMGAAPGIPIQNVRIGRGPMQSDLEAVVLLRGDNVHLERLTLILRHRCNRAISAWPASGNSMLATGGHLIENVSAFAVAPEAVGANSIIRPLRLGPDTTVRNCHFYGHFETPLRLTNAHRTRIVGNTFVYFQNINSGEPAFDADSTSDLDITNNVVVAMNPTPIPMVLASTATTGLVVRGNAVEGFAGAVGAIQGQTPDINGNVVGPVPLDTPLRARLASDAPTTLRVVAGEGLSLDGTWLGSGPAWPGAFQIRSATAMARPAVVTVGDGDCGGSPCDFPTTLDNELQQAVWNAWPPATIEVFPTASPVAGNAVISWQLNLRGRGATPGDVVLAYRDEDAELAAANGWTRHDSILSVQQHVQREIIIENLELRARDLATRAAIFIGSGDEPHEMPTAWRTVRRVIINTGTVGATGVDTAMHLGDMVRVTDSLIYGPFRSCVRFGHRSGNDPDRATELTTGCVANLTCRLTGTGASAPTGAFEVAAVDGTVFANVVVEQAVDAPAFVAQRRATGDTGMTAADLPLSFNAQTFSLRGYTADFDGFVPADGSYTVVIDLVAPMDPLFVSAVDSHLAVGAAPIDTGVDPGTISVDLSAGIDLDGTDRTGRMIDRGAFEQGL